MRWFAEYVSTLHYHHSPKVTVVFHQSIVDIGQENDTQRHAIIRADFCDHVDLVATSIVQNQ